MKPRREAVRLLGLSLSACLVVASLCCLLYLLLSPLVVGGTRTLRPRDLSLMGARDYYSVLGNIVTIPLALLGLALGYYYYVDRHKNETDEAARERQRELLKDLMEHLEKIQSSLDEAALRGPTSPEGRKSLHAVLRSLESAVQIVEYCADLTSGNAEGAAAIVELNSFLELPARRMLEVSDAAGRAALEKDWLDQMDGFPEYLYRARSACLARWR
jgi:hypothetical protein